VMRLCSTYELLIKALFLPLTLARSYFFSLLPHSYSHPTSLPLYIHNTLQGQTEEGADNEGEDYQLEMMRCLREINVDNNMVGWYLSTISGSYQVVDIIEIFVTYMENLERCICIVYDTAAASTGSFGFKAIRLTDTFVEAYKSGGLTIEKVATRKLSWRDVFVEIPITLHNSPIAAALAAEISSCSTVNANDLDRLTLNAGPVLEKNLEFLNDCLDDLVGEQTKLNNHHHAVKRQMQAVAQWKVQRRQENQARRAAGEEPLPEDPPEGQFKAIQEPSQLDNMLLANQMSTYCDHIGVVASEAINKLLLVEKLQKTL